MPEQVGLVNSRGRIKNIETAQAKVSIKKFKLNWTPIALKTGKVRFIKATIA